MFLNMYSIYDTVAEIFNKPFSDVNDASAIRAFSQSLEENKNKNDYVLYHIGGFDDNSGTITCDKAPLKLKSGFELKIADVTPLPENLKKQSGI